MPKVKSSPAKKIDVEAAGENAVTNFELDGETPLRFPATFEIIPTA